MSGSYKELRKKAVAEEFSSPELMNMRKKLAVCFIAFIVCRVAFSVYETVYIVLREADLSFIISNLCLTALTAFPTTGYPSCLNRKRLPSSASTTPSTCCLVPRSSILRPRACRFLSRVRAVSTRASLIA